MSYKTYCPECGGEIFPRGILDHCALNCEICGKHFCPDCGAATIELPIVEIYDKYWCRDKCPKCNWEGCGGCV